MVTKKNIYLKLHGVNNLYFFFSLVKFLPSPNTTVEHVPDHHTPPDRRISVILLHAVRPFPITPARFPSPYPLLFILLLCFIFVPSQFATEPPHSAATTLLLFFLKGKWTNHISQLNQKVSIFISNPNPVFFKSQVNHILVMGLVLYSINLVLGH